MAITHLLNQTVTLRNPAGTRDRHGKPALDAGASLKARFQRTYKTIVTEQRDREPIHAVVFTGPSTVVEIGAKVTYESEDYRVMQVSDIRLGNGQVHHYELMCQLWSFAS